jgi:type IV pilus assembly protein PilV
LQRSHSHGFTLVETVVAMFVLALGVVGVAATQVSSARLRQQAALESEAVQLAASLGARMRVNAHQMALPDAANPYLNFEYDAAGGEPAPPPLYCFGGADCDPAGIAAFDLYDTARIVHSAFPGGRIAVCRDGGPGVGTIADWSCTGASGAPIVVKLGWRTPARAGEPAPEATPFVTMVVAG